MNKKLNDTCQVFCFNAEAVNEVKKKMLSRGEMRRLAETFKVLGDRTRVSILQALSIRELCVCDLSTVLGMSSSAVSHQLRVLRDACLVKYRREGKMVYYSLDDEHIVNIFDQGLQHIRHTER